MSLRGQGRATPRCSDPCEQTRRPGPFIPVSAQGWARAGHRAVPSPRRERRWPRLAPQGRDRGVLEGRGRVAGGAAWPQGPPVMRLIARNHPAGPVAGGTESSQSSHSAFTQRLRVALPLPPRRLRQRRLPGRPSLAVALPRFPPATLLVRPGRRVLGKRWGIRPPAQPPRGARDTLVSTPGASVLPPDSSQHGGAREDPLPPPPGPPGTRKEGETDTRSRVRQGLVLRRKERAL